MARHQLVAGGTQTGNLSQHLLGFNIFLMTLDNKWNGNIEDRQDNHDHTGKKKLSLGESRASKKGCMTHRILEKML